MLGLTFSFKNHINFFCLSLKELQVVANKNSKLYHHFIDSFIVKENIPKHFLLFSIRSVLYFVNTNMVLMPLFCNSCNKHCTDCMQSLVEYSLLTWACREWLKALFKQARKICIMLPFCMPHEKVFLRCGMVVVSILPDVKSYHSVTRDKPVVC